jgi:hypothetical protein
MDILNIQTNRKSEHHKHYLKADKWVGINEDDSVLTPIYLSLPEPPNIRYIDGYGLPPLKQRWKRLETPRRLEQLENRVIEILEEENRKSKHEVVTSYKIQEKFWELLYENTEHYDDEIKFIKRINYYMRYGYWFFVKGKPTWITPWHFFYLQFCYMKEEDDHYVEYRDKDRKSEIFEWYEYTTRETFEKIDSDGKAIPDEFGDLTMIEMSNRTSYGDQEPKRRRGGATMKGVCKLFWFAMTKEGQKCIITSFTPEEAREKIWDPIVLPIFQNLPIYIKPVNKMSDDPAKAIVFKKPSNVYKKKHLDSKIFMAENSKMTASDGGKSHCRLDDEQGKIKIVDTEKRWETNKLTMSQGARVWGFAKHPSTVEELNEGGLEYKNLWDDSDFYRRKPNGQTFSGLFRQFWKSWEGYDGFIDYWGFSVVETPTEEQLKYAPKHADFKALKKGAKQYILENRDSLRRKTDAKSKEKYRVTIRKEPIDSTECFMGSSGSIGFDIEILDNRIKELEAMKKQTVSGNFEWVNGERFGDVYWDPREDGKFEKSFDLHPNETNRKLPGKTFSNIQKKMIDFWKPQHPNRFIIGVDPVEYTNKTEAKLMKKSVRASDFALTLKIRKYPTDVDQDKRNWQGDRAGLTYRYQSLSIDEMCEDVLKAAIWAESLIFFERNQGRELWRNIIEWGFGGYLGYGTTPDGKVNEDPGFYIQGSNKSEGFNLTGDHIRYRGHVERHMDLLKEWREIPGPEMMKKYDLVSAWIQCELGERSGYIDMLEQYNVESDINVDALMDYMGSMNYLS